MSDIRFFFDNNLSQHLVEGLKAFGQNVMHLTEIFDEATPDYEWLEYVGKEMIFVITRVDIDRLN